jgi:hypothetical protein
MFSLEWEKIKRDAFTEEQRRIERLRTGQKKYKKKPQPIAKKKR